MAESPAMTDRMVILDTLLRERAGESLQDFIASRWLQGNGKSWDRIAEEMRLKLEGTGYEPPRESVIQYAIRFGIIPTRPKGQARRRSRRTTDAK
jgi:hypothetical protein